MMRQQLKHVVRAMMCTASVFLSLSAQAALGGNRESIAIDHQALAMKSTTITSGSGYQIHELQHPNGSSVKEFVSPQGKVFAVHWEGSAPANLSQILGDHYAEYLSALKNTPHSHHLVQIKQDNLVVTHIQYLRNFSGNAYVPSLVPANVDPTQLN